jgi:molybdopterin synthase catalytic subunit/molybdopterin converting factor small subunit
MQIHVLFFGVLKDAAGRGIDALKLPENSTLADLLAHYSASVPKLKDHFTGIAMSINQEFAQPTDVLHEGDEVALLPPVSGGADTTSPKSNHCVIVRNPIDTVAVANALKRPEDGATAIFEGIVRNNTRGRQTLYLDYESYEAMALKKMEELAARALADFKIRDVALAHRLGRLEIGETSVLIVVASTHRGPAFDACRWLIDTLKRTVPIWKKEYFIDGAVWADGEPFPPEIGGAPLAPTNPKRQAAQNPDKASH